MTPRYLRKLFLQQHPKTLRIATLLRQAFRAASKRLRRTALGFSIPNLFVIGYGMDYADGIDNLAGSLSMASDHPEYRKLTPRLDH